MTADVPPTRSTFAGPPVGVAPTRGFTWTLERDVRGRSDRDAHGGPRRGPARLLNDRPTIATVCPDARLLATACPPSAVRQTRREHGAGTAERSPRPPPSIAGASGHRLQTRCRSRRSPPTACRASGPDGFPRSRLPRTRPSAATPCHGPGPPTVLLRLVARGCGPHGSCRAPHHPLRIPRGRCGRHRASTPWAGESPMRWSAEPSSSPFARSDALDTANPGARCRARPMRDIEQVAFRDAGRRYDALHGRARA